MSSSAPKRRLDVRQETPQRTPGKRTAQRRKTRKRSFTPTPAMAGAFILVLAAFGSTLLGNHDGDSLANDKYQTISQSYVGPDDAAANGKVDISRSFDRELTTKQIKVQAQQVLTAQADLKKKVTAQSALLKKNQWVVPVTGYHLTARFGQRSGLWATIHTGLDFAGPSGSTIVSVAAGVVKSTGYEGAYGNRTIITLRDGTDIWYCHQSRIAVSVGQAVGPGDVIGYTGSTGNVTGPHLHLEVHPGGGAAVDPEPVLRQHGVNP
ncbi:M23 family metallopeptidase [Aeromicrobium ginsengisoli]|uniref:M23 family metallopeptidase n=1 Tax=Aeromicrobium ginsengisoli TaxID=363867 RepID=A0A5M4FE07_9ACTN|nr:M23 family metallopeptidase [Aeromicrobium ginsengisoli]KAA1397440.1 M23 family metallopeptidase [Aeromicrobium ginsengisoli]